MRTQIKTKKEMRGFLLLFESALYMCISLSLWMAVFSAANIAIFSTDIISTIGKLLNCSCGTGPCPVPPPAG